VSRPQLSHAGLSKTVIRNRVRDGRLRPLHRSVYAVGHARLTREGRWMAAVLAIGPWTVLSHRSAAALHGLRRQHGGRVEVTTVFHRASTDRIEVHARRRLHLEDRVLVDGIPVTSVARTLVDLADVLRPEQLRSVLVQADEQRSADLHETYRALARVRGRPGRGHARLRAALDEVAARNGARTRSDLEELLLSLVAKHGLPRPRTNVWFPAEDGSGVEVDAIWRAERVAVELDSWRHHRSRDAFDRDRRKGNTLLLAGWTVLRFTDDDLDHRPADVAATLATALQRRPLSSNAG